MLVLRTSSGSADLSSYHTGVACMLAVLLMGALLYHAHNWWLNCENTGNHHTTQWDPTTTTVGLPLPVLMASGHWLWKPMRENFDITVLILYYLYYSEDINLCFFDSFFFFIVNKKKLIKAFLLQSEHIITKTCLSKTSKSICLKQFYCICLW